MKLKYRGVTYDYTPPTVATEPSGLRGVYRGLEWRHRNVTKGAVQQPTLDLVYRGVAYRTGEQPASVPVVPAPQPVTTHNRTKELARALMMGHHNSIKRREQSLLSRAAAEVGLGADAANYWRPIQGKINSGFRASYDRSAAAMS